MLSYIHWLKLIKLRIETANVSKRQQPNQRADNIRIHQWIFNAAIKSRNRWRAIADT